MNFEEYRTQVLSVLGMQNGRDMRYFEDYRRTILTGLGAEFSTEDLRNEEKWNNKIIEAVANTKQSIKNLIDGDKYTYKTVSGAVASFDDGAYNMPVKTLTVGVNCVQSGSGTPSPTNIRPILGKQIVAINQSGEDEENVKTVKINLNQAVYGGELEAVSGSLKITYAVVDMGSITWISGNGGFYANMSTISDAPKAAFKGVSSSYKYGGAYNVCQNNQFGYIFNSVPFVKDSRYTDAAAFKEAVEGVQLVYELDSPVTVQVDPTEIYTFGGKNQIWSESDNVAVEYLADTSIE